MNRVEMTSRALLGRLVGCSRQFLAARSLFIQVQDTPNPQSLKFIPGQPVLGDAQGTREFTSVSMARQSPLAMQLFRVDGVKSVFFGDHFITITKKDEDMEWAVMKPDIFATIMDFFQSGKALLNEDGGDGGAAPADTAILPEDDDTVSI